MRTETELGRSWPKAKGCLEPSGTGRGKKDPPPEPAEGTRPCDPWILDFLSPEPRDERFLLFQAATFVLLSCSRLRPPPEALSRGNGWVPFPGFSVQWPEISPRSRETSSPEPLKASQNMEMNLLKPSIAARRLRPETHHRVLRSGVLSAVSPTLTDSSPSLQPLPFCLFKLFLSPFNQGPCALLLSPVSGCPSSGPSRGCGGFLSPVCFGVVYLLLSAGRCLFPAQRWGVWVLEPGWGS